MEKRQAEKKATYQTPEIKRNGNLKDITAGKTATLNNEEATD